MWKIGDGSGRRTAELRIGALALFGAVCIYVPAASAQELPGCKGTAGLAAKAHAVRARDGATIELADRREVRLAGVVAALELDGDPIAAQSAAAALDALVAGRSITLHAAAETHDRYGRSVAQVAVEGDPARWVQAALVRAGALRVAPGTGQPDCAKVLLGEEREARRASSGLWGDRRFGIQEAADRSALLAASGRFAVVEGTIVRIGEAGGSVFLDFAERYRAAFTIVIPRAAQSAFAEAGIDPRALSGKRVRARGVIYRWGGPALEIQVPAALELVGADGI
jgi:endonuclease YncB( thermonuclease family)